MKKFWSDIWHHVHLYGNILFLISLPEWTWKNLYGNIHVQQISICKNPCSAKVPFGTFRICPVSFVQTAKGITWILHWYQWNIDIYLKLKPSGIRDCWLKYTLKTEKIVCRSTTKQNITKDWKKKHLLNRQEFHLCTRKS